MYILTIASLLVLIPIAAPQSRRDPFADPKAFVAPFTLAELEAPRPEGRNLNRYVDGGVFDFPLLIKGHEAAIYEQLATNLRDFVWRHWTTRRRAYVRVVHHGIEGQHVVEHLYIEPKNRTAWHIAWVTTAIDWRFDQVPRRRVRPGAVSIERIPTQTDYVAWRWRYGYAVDEFDARAPLPSASDNSRAYMLQFRDRRGSVVAFF